MNATAVLTLSTSCMKIIVFILTLGNDFRIFCKSCGYFSCDCLDILWLERPPSIIGTWNVAGWGPSRASVYKILLLLSLSFEQNFQMKAKIVPKVPSCIDHTTENLGADQTTGSTVAQDFKTSIHDSRFSYKYSPSQTIILRRHTDVFHSR